MKINTFDELLLCIEDIMKEKDTLEPEDIYQLGVLHKTLPREEKSWPRLASAINWKSSGENLRNFVNVRMRKDGILKPSLGITSQMKNSKDERILNEVKELQKEQIKVREEWSAYKRALREDARIERLQESLKDAVNQLPSLPPFKREVSQITNYNNEAILLISDLHIGVECDNFYNKYNATIAKERVNKLVNETIDYCKMHKVYKLNVINLGDMIHGIIHTNARIEQEFDVVQQVITASEILAEALYELQNAAPIVLYRSVIDNHSRAVANKNEAIENENLNKLIDWYLQERLKNTTITIVNDNIDDGIGKFDLMNGKKIMFSHGHQDNINQAFQHFVGASKEFIDYALLGHYHSEKIKSYNGFKVIVNGSIVGTEQYALSKRLFSSPSQTLLIFNRDNLINISIDLETKK